MQSERKHLPLHTRLMRLARQMSGFADFIETHALDTGLFMNRSELASSSEISKDKSATPNVSFNK